MDWKLEVVVLPVADVARAKDFYENKVGFAVDVDHRAGDDFRVVQLTPPGSACSISVTVEKNVLTVHAERRRSGSEGVELLVGERPHGTFSRQLFLGEGLDTERIDATYTDGVLSLRLPVAEKAKPRRVPINASDSAPTAIDTKAEEFVGAST